MIRALLAIDVLRDPEVHGKGTAFVSLCRSPASPSANEGLAPEGLYLRRRGRDSGEFDGARPRYGPCETSVAAEIERYKDFIGVECRLDIVDRSRTRLCRICKGRIHFRYLHAN